MSKPRLQLQVMFCVLTIIAPLSCAATENFTTFSEQDVGNDLSVAVSKVTGTSMQTRNTDYWVVKDYGASNFGDFTHTFDVQVSSIGSLQILNFWMLSNATGDSNDLSGSQAIKFDYYQGVNKFRLMNVSDSVKDESLTVTSGTTYYVTVDRSGTTCTADIYTDQARTNLFDSLSITCTSTAFQYLTVMAGHNTAANTNSINGFTQNLDLAGTGAHYGIEDIEHVPAKVKQNLMNVYPTGLKINQTNTCGNNIASFNGNQYVGFWDADGHLVLVKRAYGDSEWETKVFSSITLTGNDNHDSVNIGFDPNGYLHVAYDHHNDALKYRKSTSAEDILALSSTLSMLGTNESSVTYPSFWNDANGNLYVSFRDGISGDGDFYIYKYNHSTATWVSAPGLTNGLFIQGKPQDMNAYLSRPFIDSNNDAWFTFQWRTGGSGYGNDEDIVLIRYDLDTGNVYQHDGDSQTVPITKANQDAYFNTLGTGPPVHRRTVAVDSVGNVFFVFEKTDSRGYRQVYFTRRISGVWQDTQQLTNSFVDAPVVPYDASKWPKLANLFIDENDNLYVVSVGGQEGRQIHIHESQDKGVTWQLYSAFQANVGEWNGTTFDFNLWDSDNILDTVISFMFDRSVTYPRQPVHLIEWRPGDRYPQNTDYGFTGYESVTVKSLINSELS